MTREPKSDIDIMVEFEPAYKTFDNYMELKLFLERILHLEVLFAIYGVVEA